MKPNGLNILSLFCGCGGFDLGFKKAGFRCLASFDSDPLAVAVHRRNLKSVAEIRDLASPASLADLPTDVDVVVAGPPCQGFSTAGKREIDDPRNGLLIVPALVAASTKAKVVVVENVSGVAAGGHRVHWENLKKALLHYGYQTAEFACNAARYGVPQLRNRLILLAWNTEKLGLPQLEERAGGVLGDVLLGAEGLSNHNVRILAPGGEPAKIAELIGPGQKLCNVRGGPRSVHTWDIPEVYGATSRSERLVLETLLRLRRRDRKRPNGDADPVTARSIKQAVGRPVGDQLRTLARKGYIRCIGRAYDLSHTFNGKYRRLRADEPSPTVDTRFGDPRYFLHPEENRGFTVREAARIQGFPDSFVFEGSLEAQYRLIGNAVPPPLATRVARLIRRLLLDR